MPYQLITVEGNIGAGKTTLAKMLAKDLDAKLVLERFEDNPFLPQFFKNFEEKAFATELFFMAERYHQLQQEMQAPDLFHQQVVMDYLFTKSLLYAKANLDEAEFGLFQRLFDIINPRLPQPELVIYVHADIPRLKANIQRRGRDFEQSVTDEYLKKIQDNAFAWFHQHPDWRILILDNTDTDFVAQPEHYQWIRSLLDQEWNQGMHHLRVGQSLEEQSAGLA